MPGVEENFKLIKAARLIDGNGGPSAERAAILLKGDRIMAVGTEETVRAPEGAQVHKAAEAGRRPVGLEVPKLMD